MRITILTIVAILFFFSGADGQLQSPTPLPDPSPMMRPAHQRDSEDADVRRSIADPHRHRTADETYMGWGVLVFGIVIIGMEIAVMLRLKKGWGTQSIRITGITLVLISGIFLIVAGYSQEQIAPMIGLLGTIIGFLLGKTSKETE